MYTRWDSDPKAAIRRGNYVDPRFLVAAYFSEFLRGPFLRRKSPPGSNPTASWEPLSNSGHPPPPQQAPKIVSIFYRQRWGWKFWWKHPISDLFGFTDLSHLSFISFIYLPASANDNAGGFFSQERAQLIAYSTTGHAPPNIVIYRRHETKSWLIQYRNLVSKRNGE